MLSAVFFTALCAEGVGNAGLLSFRRVRGSVRPMIATKPRLDLDRMFRLGVAAWLLVGIPACSQETALPDAAAQVPADDVQARQVDADEARRQELAARYAQEVATDEDRLAAEQGDADAQALLAIVYYNGRGVEVDYEEAVRWARLAAEQGNGRAQSLLGAAYFNGNGVAQDFAEAARWSQLAAEQGVASAQALLGVLYMNGTGVPQDDISAYMWLTVAASNSEIPGPGRFRDLIATRMTSEQIAEAQARAADR